MNVSQFTVEDSALRDALLPKLLSGELRLPSQSLRQAGVSSGGNSTLHTV
jgi:hypothetical protein